MSSYFICDFHSIQLTYLGLGLFCFFVSTCVQAYKGKLKCHQSQKSRPVECDFIVKRCVDGQNFGVLAYAHTLVIRKIDGLGFRTF